MFPTNYPRGIVAGLPCLFACLLASQSKERYPYYYLPGLQSFETSAHQGGGREGLTAITTLLPPGKICSRKFNQLVIAVRDWKALDTSVQDCFLRSMRCRGGGYERIAEVEGEREKKQKKKQRVCFVGLS